MLVLDENLPAGQQLLLRKWRIRSRVIGKDVAFSGATDENLIPVLRRLAQPTFFSLDKDFYRPEWAHPHYCLVWLDVRARHAADYIRRFLRHPAFNAHAKRAGIVVRVDSDELVCWQFGKRSRTSIPWKIR